MGSERAGAPIAGRHLGVKTVTVFPDNAARGKPAVFGTYLLLSAETGETLAVMDATRLTAWRTGAASALASRYLSRADASRLLMVGAGALAPQLVAAHASVRPIREVALWNRSPERARALGRHAGGTGLDVSIAGDLEAAVRRADIVSAATISAEPLIRGDWLAPGTHVDCVGAYKPSMRETDDAVVRRARIFVDTRPGAFAEAGDIVQPLAGRRDRQGGRPRRSVRSHPRHGRRAANAGGNHLLQVRRRRHRGPGGGHCRLWRCLTLWVRHHGSALCRRVRQGVRPEGLTPPAALHSTDRADH